MQSGLDYGYGAPFVRLFYKDQELSAIVDSMDYEYDEEGDDVCKLDITVENREEADKPYWQEQVELKVIWGFIEGEVSDARKIFIQDIDWKFSKESITAKIEATDKANSMKYADSQEVHTNTSLVGMAYKMAQKHDLKAFFQTDGESLPEFILPDQPGEFLETYLKKNFDAVATRGLKRVQDYAKEHPKENRIAITEGLAKVANNEKNFFKNEKDRGKREQLVVEANLLAMLKRHANVPQANKTDAQIMDELGRRENNGPFIVDTRDDELIIKKRNFKQEPYKAYTFGGEEGTLVQFIPMNKNRSRKQNSMNVGFSNWNALDKTAFAGNANGLSDENPTLTEFRKMYTFYKALQDKGHGKDKVGNLVIKQKHININSPNFLAKIDNSADYTKANLYTWYTVDDKVRALEQSIKNYEQTLNNSVYNPLGNNPQDAYQQAHNDRRSNELKMNPAVASIYGDPNLKVGKIITILGISKKYSGNYYIIKANHKIDKVGYMVSLEMATQGQNIKASPDHYKARGKVNRNIGPASGKKDTKKIKVKTNP